MLRKALLAVAVPLIAYAFLFVKLSGVENATTIHLPDPTTHSMYVRVSVDILEEWIRSALVALPFAIAIAFIYKRSWLWVSALVSLPQFALDAFNYRWFGCRHMTWVADCVQLHAQKAFMLTLLTWLVVKVVSHARAL